MWEAAVLDFTSSLYLGFWHESQALPPWPRLTTGAPAALVPPARAAGVAARLALLQGCERATLAVSTLHLFWDLFGLLTRSRIAVYVDSGAYPIGRWALVQAAARGTPVYRFPHCDVAALHALVERTPDRRPIVLADGLCICCGAVTPLVAYREIIEPYDGLLVVDDTQALGLLGRDPAREAPYGVGGGGLAQYSRVPGKNVVLVCSLAKSFGVPIAVLSGSRALVERFEATSQTRVHCSPPSAAHLRAADHALELNETVGDTARRRLVQRVGFFREQLAGIGLRASGGLLPNQSLPPLPADAAAGLYRRLLDAGVRTALLSGEQGTGRLRFILTARHRLDAIQQAVRVLADLVQPTPPRSVRPGFHLSDAEWDGEQRPKTAARQAG
jgi:8-amino-7-oxononanoate synthase